MLRRVAAFCWPLWPVLLRVSFPRSRSPVVGVPGLCWMWHGVPFARQWRPVVSVWRLCWLLAGSFDCFCCPRASVHRPSITPLPPPHPPLIYCLVANRAPAFVRGQAGRKELAPVVQIQTSCCGRQKHGSHADMSGLTGVRTARWCGKQLLPRTAQPRGIALTLTLTLTLIKTEYWDRAGGGGYISYDWLGTPMSHTLKAVDRVESACK